MYEVGWPILFIMQFAEDGRGTIKLAVMMPTELEVDNRQLSRAVGAGDRGWRAMTPAQILAEQFTLSQRGEGQIMPTPHY